MTASFSRFWSRRRFSPRVLFCWSALFWVATLHASEVKIFRTSSAEAFLEGTLEGVSLDPVGTLRLAQRVERLTGVEEPFVFSAARLPDGWVLGTGNDGKVLRVDQDGLVEELFRVDEPEIYAVWSDAAGTVYAGSSPDGKVYRYRGGHLEVVLAPEQKYIWSITQDSEGRLVVGTGTEGKLFRLDAEGTSEILYDGKDAHIRTLLAMPNGDLVAGTAGEGLILRIAADGQARTLFDSPQPEVTSLAADEEGAIYAAVLASEASFVDLTRSSAPKPSGDSGAKSAEGRQSGQPEIKISVQEGSVAAGSRPAGFSGARSAVVKIAPSGASEIVWRFEKETVFALHYDQRLWAGTGLAGKLYSLHGDQMVLQKDVDEAQIVALLDGATGPAFATTNAAAFYRTSSGLESKGTYTSDVLDAGSVSRFGTLHWQGAAERDSEVRFQVRTGMSADPDATWSPWSKSVGGREVSLGDTSAGRYVQWRATLETKGAATPSVVAVDLSYVQSNRKPSIESLEVLGPGQIVVPANFNASNQAFEPASPNRDGIFTTIGKPGKRDASARKKRLWKKGYRTLEWKAEDPNGDELEYALSFRREGAADVWLPIAEEIDDSYYSFDSTVLPDWIYRFRLVASDHPSNLAGETKTSAKLSEVVAIDHSPPALVAVERTGGALTARVRDEWSPLREAVYSVDAGEWRPVTAVDGLIDARSERLRIQLPDDAVLVLLRLTDTAFNVTTYDLSEQLDATVRGGGS